MKMKINGENCTAQSMKMAKPFSWKDLECHSIFFNSLALDLLGIHYYY